MTHPRQDVPDDKRVKRKQHAERLLNDPLLTEAFDQIEEDATERWKSATEAEKREACWRQVNSVREVRRYLRTIISQGEFAKSLHERREAKKN